MVQIKFVTEIINLPATFQTIINKFLKDVTNFIWTITPGILDKFQQSK